MWNLLFLRFLWTYLWIHLVVGYLSHTLSVLSNQFVLARSCQACLGLLSSFRCFHFRQLIITHLGEAVLSVSLHVFLYRLQLIPISLVPHIPLSSADGSFPWCSEFLSVLSFYQGLQKLFYGICSCCCFEKFLMAFCCPLISLFWCCFQYYILPLIGTFVVVDHSHNYPYHTGFCLAVPTVVLVEFPEGAGCTVEIIYHWIHERYISIISWLILWCTGM